MEKVDVAVELSRAVRCESAKIQGVHRGEVF